MTRRAIDAMLPVEAQAFGNAASGLSGNAAWNTICIIEPTGVLNTLRLTTLN